MNQFNLELKLKALNHIKMRTARKSPKGPSKELKVELPYDPAIPLLGIYLKKSQTLL